MLTPKQAMEAAIRLRRLAIEVDEIAMVLDDRGDACPHCAALRYHNWQQRQLRSRVSGASERLREIADTFERRQNDREFLGSAAEENPT